MDTIESQDIPHLEFLQRKLPQCPLDQNLLKKSVRTHKTTRLKEIQAPLILLPRNFLTPQLHKRLSEILEVLPKVRPPYDNVQPLYNEQCVAMLNQMIQSEEALDTDIAKFLRRMRYRVVIRSQQLERFDQSRMDHVFALESYFGYSEKEAPPKSPDWCGAQTFHTEIVRLMRIPEGVLLGRMKRREYVETLPRLALVVAEEKKARTISRAQWDSILRSSTNTRPVNVEKIHWNVNNTSSQLRRQIFLCPTEETMPLYIEECALKMGPTGSAASGKSAIILRDRTADDYGPRYIIVAMASVCLLDAKVIESPDKHQPIARKTDPKLPKVGSKRKRTERKDQRFAKSKVNTPESTSGETSVAGLEPPNITITIPPVTSSRRVTAGTSTGASINTTRLSGGVPASRIASPSNAGVPARGTTQRRLNSQKEAPVPRGKPRWNY
ncbi:hypothetical protein F5146DRAFT_1005160 [Armillaria mellea]|nr:hypothetical protein F5146DRAFT_1005160 [Armillaria mellea]